MPVSFILVRAPFEAPFFVNFIMAISSEASQHTYAGQAGWCDPSSELTCRLCAHWSKPGERVARSRYRYFDKHELAPRPCLKARQLNPEISAPVPHAATACAHFQANPAPPPIWAPHSGGIAKQTVSKVSGTRAGERSGPVVLRIM